MKRIAVALFLVACSRSRHETTLTSATLDAAASQRDLVNLAEQWDRALALRDPSLVAQVYADRVAFYGIPLRHDQVVSVQAFAIDADPSFTQRITKTRVDGTRVVVDREWVRFGKQHTGHMWLTGAVEHGHWVVTSVGDDASDARARPAPSAAARSCEAMATRVALSTREGNALVEGPPDHVNVRIAATPPSFPAYAVAMTTMAAGVPTTVAWYDVVPCSIHSPGPNVQPTSGACVTPGDTPGAVTDALTNTILSPDLHLLAEMSRCSD